MVKVFHRMITAAVAVVCVAGLLTVPVRADERNDAYLESIRESAIAAADARDREAAEGLAKGLMHLVAVDLSTLQSMAAKDAQAADELERAYAYMKELDQMLADSQEGNIIREASYIDSIDLETAKTIAARDLQAVSDSIADIRYLLSIDAKLDPSIAEEDIIAIDTLSDIVNEVQALVSALFEI
ncbi:MAG: hypothetical protein IJ873_00975 [Lachnospiraceae bacterium]|nr:hypothetical protein [Lachnospiraceae bacterium]MBR2274627.1 hypothetical protein [Lachnospiraceae bacterium]